MTAYPPARVKRTLAKYVTRRTEVEVTEGIALAITEVEEPYALFERAVEREQRRPGAELDQERLPYWAEVWPAAVALARWFGERRPEPVGGEMREFGCGLGVGGIALARLGWRVHATDYVEDALVFAHENARRNLVGAQHRVGYLDWGQPVGEPLAWAVASDVVYERRSHLPLARAVHQLLLPGGRFYLCDPQRPTARHFVELLRDRGFAHRHESYRVVWRSSGCTVDIHRFDRPR